MPMVFSMCQLISQILIRPILHIPEVVQILKFDLTVLLKSLLLLIFYWWCTCICAYLHSIFIIVLLNNFTSKHGILWFDHLHKRAHESVQSERSNETSPHKFENYHHQASLINTNQGFKDWCHVTNNCYIRGTTNMDLLASTLQIVTNLRHKG